MTEEPYLFHLGEKGETIDNIEVEDDTLIEDEWRAGFFVTDDNLVVEFGDPADPKNIVLEFAHVGEKAIVEKVLEDRNFWVQIVNALSAALKDSS